MKARYLLLLILITSCGTNVPTNPEEGKLEETLQAILDEAIIHSQDQLKGLSLALHTPDIQWVGVSGYDSKEKEDLVGKDQPYRIASMTKSFTAVAILRLHEMDSLSIDDTIDKHISQDHINILQAGGYETDKITLRHCLHHTAGFYNYARVDNEFAELVKLNGSKRWTRTEQLQGSVDWGEKVGEPGERYSYCDTGYILLGEIIEKFSSGDLALGYRRLLKFDELGMNNTWLETLEEHPADSIEPVHRYFRGGDVTRHDPSFDLYGGGGLMSTGKDLVIFLDALFGSKIFDKKETLDLLVSKTAYFDSYDFDNDERYKDYRLGFWKVNLFGEDAYMHNGIWGSSFIHIPAWKVSCASNGTRRTSERAMKKAILSVNNYFGTK